MAERAFQRKLDWSLGIFGLYAFVWYAHVGLSANSDPLGVPFDFVLWGAASVLKILAAASTLWLLGQVHRMVYGSRALFSAALRTWASIAIAVVVVLALSRAWWAPLFTTDATKYYHAGDTLRLSPELARQRAAWSQAWSHGYVVGAESALMLALAVVQAGMAFRFGNRPVFSVLGACVLSAALLGAYLTLCPWFRSDYDFFHGDVLGGALLLDAVSVVASDPYSSLTLPLYFSLALCHVALLRKHRPALERG